MVQSLFIATSSNMGDHQAAIILSFHASKNHQLPDKCTIVPAVALRTVNVTSSTVQHLSNYRDDIWKEHKQEMGWLEQTTNLMEKGVKKIGSVSWDTFHASPQSSPVEIHVALTQLLPLFSVKAAIAAMMKHRMDVLHQATEFLNPGQVPVLAHNAPLYALATVCSIHCML